MLSQSEAVGGYFELELPDGNGQYYPEALKYQSARSAFYALLMHYKPKKVWMPYYICDSMLAPLDAAGILVSFYSMNADFSIKDAVELGDKDLLLYVNYFGLCSKIEDELLEKFDPEKLILDHSQAFFEQPKNCLATIYSPRKFFGVPDGGLLITSLDIKDPEHIDQDSIHRAKHLLLRLAGEPEDGYEAYQQAEESLKSLEPKRMSLLTERMLSSIDYEAVKVARENNFRALHAILAEKNYIDLEFNNVVGPMVYPYMPASSAKSLKSDLIKQRWFIATYWPECERRIDSECFESVLLSNLMALPIDQRYKMERFENDL